MQKLKPLNFLVMLLSAYLVYRWIDSILFPRERKPLINLAVEHINAPQSQGNNYIMRGNTAVNNKSYDNVWQDDIKSPEKFIIEPGTVHSYTYQVMGGNCDITIDEKKLNYIDGDFGDDTATGTIKQRILFEPKAGCTVRIKKMY